MSSDKPHYPLADIQTQMSCVADLVITGTALQDMLDLGISKREVVRIIQRLSADVFYKSMPSHKFPGCHQDVYRPKHDGEELYVKFSHNPEVEVPTIGDYRIVSFRER